jgi:hypothetical protein
MILAGILALASIAPDWLPPSASRSVPSSAERLNIVGQELARWELLRQLPLHIVVRGETLAALSQYYFVKLRDLTAVNQI